jgi:adenine-specific DNA-methyltransferase
MHLDDIEDAHVPRVEQYLSEIKIIRSISYKIIAFLEQLENFQKNLWLKKKFIVETNYCITLDRIAKELYQIILANNPQREEWVRLFAIDSLPGYSTPLTVEFLKANDKLLVDTRFFDAMFKNKLLASINSLDDQCNGLLIHADNFQALNLIHSRFQEQVKCIYIDPP